MAFVAEQDPEI